MRLVGFDYSRPYFYMVTLKTTRAAKPLSAIVEPGVCQLNAITRAFVRVIRHFHEGGRAIEPIECFSIMPDHIHLLVKIGANPDHLRLEAIVSQIVSMLESCYAEVTGERCLVFEAAWHDWIIAKKGQLKAFTKYIRENPKRHWLRKSNARYFGRVREVDFLGRKWWAYGNVELINLPVLEPIQCHRHYKPGMPEWEAWLGRARRIGDGGAGVSTFMSACEKACGHEIALAGGKFIVLSPENFPPAEGEAVCAEGWKTRWHPSARLEPACARGDLLFITLYEPLGRQATRSELYQRCHEMGDLVRAGLGEWRNGTTLSGGEGCNGTTLSGGVA